MNDEHRNIVHHNGYDWWAQDLDEPDQKNEADLDELRRFASLSKNYARSVMCTLFLMVYGALMSVAASALSGRTPLLPGIPVDFELKYPGLTILFSFFLSGAWMIAADTRLRIASKRIRRLNIRNASSSVTLSMDTLIDTVYMTVSQGMEAMPFIEMLGDRLFALRRGDQVTLSPLRRKFLHILVSRNELSLSRWQQEHYRNNFRPRILQRKLLPAVVYGLGIVGDRSSIKVLETFTETTEDLELRQSALDSLEQIRERLKYGPEQMLRASRLPEQPDTLLRTATGPQDAQSDPDELLRANPTDRADTSAPQAGRYQSDQAGQQADMRLHNRR